MIGANSYDWGKLGKDSAAAQYAAAGSGLEIDETKPYAEVGTLPFGTEVGG
jgi:mannose-6-phosphate isomerase